LWIISLMGGRVGMGADNGGEARRKGSVWPASLWLAAAVCSVTGGGVQSAPFPVATPAPAPATVAAIFPAAAGGSCA